MLINTQYEEWINVPAIRWEAGSPRCPQPDIAFRICTLCIVWAIEDTQPVQRYLSVCLMATVAFL